jgi:expansin (peptidoglycan-binding protein)
MRATAIVPFLFAAGCGCNGGSSPIGGDPLPCGDQPGHDGEGTYYDADGSGACSFDPSPGDLMVAAANPTDFAGSSACGACAAIDGPDGSVTVRIVDLCPGCAAGDLDLSVEAFTQIADQAAGRVPIHWTFVPCDVDGPMRYRWKEGSNPFWGAFQVRNHRHEIATVEARPAGGAWTEIARESYNYFVDPAGFGEGAIDVRVSDVYGHVVEDLGVAQGDATEVAGAAQLPACE